MAELGVRARVDDIGKAENGSLDEGAGSSGEFGSEVLFESFSLLVKRDCALKVELNAEPGPPIFGVFAPDEGPEGGPPRSAEELDCGKIEEAEGPADLGDFMSLQPSSRSLRSLRTSSKGLFLMGRCSRAISFGLLGPLGLDVEHGGNRV